MTYVLVAVQRKFHAYCIVLHRLQCLAKARDSEATAMMLILMMTIVKMALKMTMMMSMLDEEKQGTAQAVVIHLLGHDSPHLGITLTSPITSLCVTLFCYVNISYNYGVCYTVMLH